MVSLAYKLTANSLWSNRCRYITYQHEGHCRFDFVGRSLLNLRKQRLLNDSLMRRLCMETRTRSFINYNPKDSDGNDLEGREALKKSIDMGVETENYIRQFLKAPHNLEYEKTSRHLSCSQRSAISVISMNLTHCISKRVWVSF